MTPEPSFMRRLTLATLLAAAVLAPGCDSKPPSLASGLPLSADCASCHGNLEGAAPPRSLVAGKTTADPEVGAHQVHLRAGFAGKVVGCAECHVVPQRFDDPGHIDVATPDHPADPAEVTFGPLATAHDQAPTWSHASATCSSTYCHGATLAGGQRTSPSWTFNAEPDYLTVLTPRSCNGCHGAPPPLPHPDRSDCAACHPATVSKGLEIVQGGAHLDGVVQAKSGCSDCHGSTQNPSPFMDTHGSTDTSSRGVGAHASHLVASPVRRALGCAECHQVPGTPDDPGHRDTPLPAELTFGRLATAPGLTPAFDGTSCSNTYCHGATLTGGKATTPVWTKVDGSLAQCDSCHGNPPPLPHSPSTRCQDCHPATVDATGAIDVAGGKHLDGKVDVNRACSACHGDATHAAPFKSTEGSTACSAVGVGAHRQHLVDSTVRAAVACSECHVVPRDVTDVGHLDSALPAELTFGPLATHAGTRTPVTPSWDRQVASCGTTYCHGATLTGGQATAPVWTTADGSQAKCDSCHGNPPPAPHPASTYCAECHPDTVKSSGDIDVARGKHIDGRIDLQPVGPVCGACHPSPPATGAHAAHFGTTALDAGARYGEVKLLEDYAPGGKPYYAFGCGNCHPTDAALHGDGVLQVELSGATAPAGSLKAKNGPDAGYDAKGTQTCGNVYCHSSGQEAPTFTASPGWTSGVKASCGGCHGNPPRYPSGDAGTPQANSHFMETQNGGVAGHFGGVGMMLGERQHGFTTYAEGSGAITCQTCHYATVDPTNTGPSGFYYLDTTGDYSSPSGTGYSCAGTTCHTAAATPGAPLGVGKAVPLKHVNGRRDVVFDPRTVLPQGAYQGPATPVPTTPYWFSGYGWTTWNVELSGASYSASDKTCTNVACHRGTRTAPPQWGQPKVLPTDYNCLLCHP